MQEHETSSEQPRPRWSAQGILRTAQRKSYIAVPTWRAIARIAAARALQYISGGDAVKAGTLIRTIAIGVLAAVTSAPATADTITVRSDYWYPYNGEPARKNEGYMIELLRKAAAENGDTIDYALMDWELALQRTLEGTSDCVVGAIESDAPNHVRTTLPWGKSQNVLYAMAGRPVTINAVSDLGKLRVGAVDDYSYGDEIDAVFASDQAQVTRVRASRRAFPLLAMKLVTGKVDVLIEDRNVADAAINELGMTGRIQPVADNLTEADDIFVACTPNERGRALAARFDATLRQARASGELNGILQRYGLTDWVQTDAIETAKTSSTMAAE